MSETLEAPARVVKLKVRDCRQRFMVKRDEAAFLLGVSVPTLDRWHAAGLIPEGDLIASSRVFSTAELRAWADYGCLPRSEWVPLWESLRTARGPR